MTLNPRSYVKVVISKPLVILSTQVEPMQNVLFEKIISFRSVAHFTNCHACSCILRNGTERDEMFLVIHDMTMLFLSMVKYYP